VTPPLRNPGRTRPRALALALAALAAALAGPLGGCVSLLPKSKPAQLYQFGQDSGAMQTTAATALGRGQAASGVVLSSVTLPRGAMSDSILTINGDQAAYIADSRWLSPAVLMFQEDVLRTFEGRAQRTRILDRGQLSVADALLRLDVSHFEVRYDGSPSPAVLVTVRASLTGVDGREAVQRVFTHREPAADNRVTLLVAAYDKAVDATLAEIVDWTDATAPGLRPSLPATTHVTTTTESTTTTQSTTHR
jgi:cholesterol transport system auxiliary component